MTAYLTGQRLVLHKCDSAGRPVTTYEGLVVAHDESHLAVEATWTRGHCDVGLFAFEDGDLFVETYYFARWWNVYEIRGRGGALRGWYCNVTRPARLVGRSLYYDDLALDLLVSPAGQVRLADQDEFRALRLDQRDAEAYRQALRAVCEIHRLVGRRCPPFQALAGERCT